MSVLSWLILHKRFELIVEKTIRYKRVSRRIKRVSVERGSTVITGLSVTVTKDQAGSADRGRPITSKFSAFFLYQIRLRSVVFLVK